MLSWDLKVCFISAPSFQSNDIKLRHLDPEQIDIDILLILAASHQSRYHHNISILKITGKNRCSTSVSQKYFGSLENISLHQRNKSESRGMRIVEANLGTYLVHIPRFYGDWQKIFWRKGQKYFTPPGILSFSGWYSCWKTVLKFYDVIKGVTKGSLAIVRQCSLYFNWRHKTNKTSWQVGFLQPRQKVILCNPWQLGIVENWRETPAANESPVLLSRDQLLTNQKPVLRETPAACQRLSF